MRVLIASENRGKISEIGRFLENIEIGFVSQTEVGFKSEPEVGRSFLENALGKARFASICSGLPSLADDSGLVVSSLKGRPGVHSARFAGDNSDDTANIAKLLRLMDGFSGDQRRASFVCAMAFLREESDPMPIVSIGIWEGVIAKSATGNNGFGYDPIFIDPQMGKTAAELTQEEKLTVSHRGKALRRLSRSLKQLLMQ